MKGNRGEWSEPYVALHLLAYKKLFMSDANGIKNENEWMSVIGLVRNETTDRIVKYRNENDMTVIEVNGEEKITVPTADFIVYTDMLKQDILNASGSTFIVSNQVTEFLNRIELNSIKAKSKNKSDIFLTTLDPRSSILREGIGFSIKSKFGNNPTLFNTAPASGVVYKVHNMTDALMGHINNMVDDKGHAAVMSRCNALLQADCRLEFVGFPIAARAKCEAFQENLELINPRLPFLIERMLWNHFFEGETRVAIKEVIERIIEENPLNISRSEIKYPYMMKTFLYASYCGMTASTLWDGRAEVNGGFITVNEDGEILANYAMDSESFKEYLYKSCYLEFPSTGERHGNYAKVYKEQDCYYFNLNFQIRIG